MQGLNNREDIFGRETGGLNQMNTRGLEHFNPHSAEKINRQTQVWRLVFVNDLSYSQTL